MCDFRRFAIGQGVKIVFYKYNIKVLYNRTLTLKITCFLFYLHVSGIPSLFKQKKRIRTNIFISSFTPAWYNELLNRMSPYMYGVI